MKIYFFKKTQLAVETLMIYGLALLVVMLAIGALIGFGILDLGNLLPDTCNIVGVAITCEEYYFSKTTGLNMEVTNNIGKNLGTLQLSSVTPSNKNDIGLINCNFDDPINFTIDGISPINEDIGNVLINGEKGTLSTQNLCLPATNLKSGKKISLNFQLNYKTVGSNLPSRPVSGKMRVTIVD